MTTSTFVDRLSDGHHLLVAFSTVGCALFGRGDPGGGVQLDNRIDTTVDVLFVSPRGVKWTFTVPVRRA